MPNAPENIGPTAFSLVRMLRKVATNGKMKMALPRGMFRRGGKLWARKDVPKEVRHIVGQTSLQQTLNTGDVNKARVVFHDVMGSFEARIANARAALAGQTAQFPVVFDLPLNPEMAATARVLDAMRPDSQALAATKRMERNLIEAGLAKPEKEPVSLDALFARWVKERQPKPNSKAEYERAKDLFKRLNTDKPIAEYIADDARKFKDKVLELTAPNGKPLSHGTRVKWFSSVKTLFKLADGNDLLTENPFEKIKLEKAKRTRAARREEWEIEELNKLFGSPVYADGKRPKAGKGEAAYWLPVLALYHGFRAGELAQLDRTDVMKKSGIWCLSIADSAEDEPDAKSVKTDNSTRVVPIHSAVIALGFIDYVQTIRGGKLWPKMKPDSIGRWAGNWSKWFGRYRKDLGLGERWTDFHSLRHGWKSAARGAGIPEDIHDEITGHENGSVGRGYGKVPVTRLKIELEKIKFDGLVIPKWNAATTSG